MSIKGKATISKKVVNFLKSESEIKNRIPFKIKNTTKLIESGIIDSYGIIKFITFLEKTFRIKFNSKDLAEDNFQTLGNIAEVVRRKQQK